MKTKKYWIWVIVSFSILVVVWPGQQITGETGLSAKDKETRGLLKDFFSKAAVAELVWANDKEVLQGLEGVCVLTVAIEPEREEYGLTAKAIKTDTELQLRQYGIKVLTQEEFLSTPTVPYLYIEVGLATIAGGNETVAGGSIAIQLKESVLLLRKPKRVCLSTTTWSRITSVVVGLGRIKDLRGHVKDLVNEFINDYLAANPKDGSTKKKGSVFDDLKKSKDN